MGNVTALNRRRALQLLTSMASLSVAGTAAAQDMPRVNWRAVSNTRLSRQYTGKWEWLRDKLLEGTNSNFAMEVVSFGELGLTGAELIRLLNVNLLDTAEVVTGYVSGELPLIEGVQLPGVYDTWDQARDAYTSWMDVVLKANEKAVGGIPYSSFGFSSQFLWSRFPVESLDDLKGKKIRVFSKAQTDYFTALGAEPLSIPLAELYSSLERGVVDAIVTGAEAGVGFKLWEVLDYVVDLQIGPGAGFVVMSRPSWEKLPADYRTLLEGLRGEVQSRGWALGAEENEMGLATVIKNGIKPTIPAKPEWKPVLRDVAERVVIPAWLNRAGNGAREAFNTAVSPLVGITL